MTFAALETDRGNVVTRLASWLRRASGALVRGNTWGDRRLRALRMLSSSEKAMVRRFLEGNTRTIHVVNPAAAFGLELAEIVSIHRDPERAASAEPFGVVIHAWAFDHVARHPELLGAAGGEREALG